MVLRIQVWIVTVDTRTDLNEIHALRRRVIVQPIGIPPDSSVLHHCTCVPSIVIPEDTSRRCILQLIVLGKLTVFDAGIGCLFPEHAKLLHSTPNGRLNAKVLLY